LICSPQGERSRTRKIKHLRQKLQDLTSQQWEARKTAVFRGMTPIDAKQYDERHDQILALTQQLNKLEV